MYGPADTSLKVVTVPGDPWSSQCLSPPQESQKHKTSGTTQAEQPEALEVEASSLFEKTPQKTNSHACSLCTSVIKQTASN